MSRGGIDSNGELGRGKSSEEEGKERRAVRERPGGKSTISCFPASVVNARTHHLMTSDGRPCQERDALPASRSGVDRSRCLFPRSRPLIRFASAPILTLQLLRPRGRLEGRTSGPARSAKALASSDPLLVTLRQHGLLT